MSEEEKKAIKYFYNLRATIDESNMLFDEDLNVKCGKETIKQITAILNLIENQQKEMENLKEIEKSHQEENGKLRVELEQEKEKNKDLEEKLKIAVAMLTKGTYPEQNEGDNDFDKQFIAIDKLKDLKEFYITECKNKNITLIPAKNLFENINILLEEK